MSRHDFTPTDEDHARTLVGRQVIRNRDQRTEVAASVMAYRLAQIDGSNDHVDAEHLRIAGAFGHVYYEQNR